MGNNYYNYARLPKQKGVFTRSGEKLEFMDFPRANIVDFLLEDDHSILEELQEIKRSINKTDVIFKIKKHIWHFELHESLENKLFMEVIRLPQQEGKEELISACKSGNTKVWALLVLLVESLDTKHSLSIQRAFFKLYEFEEIHVKNKVKVLFPWIVKIFDPDTIERLGQQALQDIQ